MRAPIWLLVVIGLVGIYMLARKAAPGTVIGAETAVADKINTWIAQVEGLSLTAYQDTAGVWTIGYGHRIVPGDGFWSPQNPSGRKTISKEEAQALRNADTNSAQRAVDINVQVPLNAAQKAALLSLAYNIGSGNFSTSTLVRYLNAGDYQAAADQFLVWNKIHDPVTGQLVVSPGLVARRAQERDLFLA